MFQILSLFGNLVIQNLPTFSLAQPLEVQVTPIWIDSLRSIIILHRVYVKGHISFTFF